MTADVSRYLDPDVEFVPEGEFTPTLYVVRKTGNNSRKVIAAFNEGQEMEAVRCVQSDPDERNIIPVRNA